MSQNNKNDSIRQSNEPSRFFRDFKTIYLKIGGQYQNKLWGELSLMPTWGVDDVHADIPLMSYGPSFGTEFTQFENKLVFGPKISFEFHFLILAAKFSVQDYFVGSNSSVKISPEIGLSFFHLAYLMYGYNFALSNSVLVDNNGSKLTFGIHIPLDGKLTHD